MILLQPLSYLFSFSICLFLVFYAPARAQSAPEIEIGIAYLEPKNKELQKLYDDMRNRKVLEDLRLFLSPLKLPRRIEVEFKECSALSVPYKPLGKVSLCYEYLQNLIKAGDQAFPSTLARLHYTTGAFAHYILNNISYAIFDVLKVPIWGNKQDAADRLTTFIFLQFGKDTANDALRGITWYLGESSNKWRLLNFGQAEIEKEQRLYNILCIAYGIDPKEFGNWGHRTLLRTQRRARCKREAEQLINTFHIVLLPHIDQEKLEKVKSIRWLRTSMP